MKSRVKEQQSPKYRQEERYAALKLIEQLYIDGKIQEHVYRNIRKEYNLKSA